MAPATESAPGAYSVPDFEEAYGIGRAKVYEELNSGRLIAHKIGDRTVILHEDALAWGRSLPRYTPETARRRGRAAKPRPEAQR